MKKLILVFTAIAFTAGALAQTDSTSRKMSPPEINDTIDGVGQNWDINNDQNQMVQINPNDKSQRDGVVMQDGKTMMVKNGEMTVLDHEMTMSNGTKVNSDGTYTKKDGTNKTMKEGQHIDKSGNMTNMKTNKNKNMYLVPDSTTQKNK